MPGVIFRFGIGKYNETEVSYLNKLKRQKSESEKMRHWNLWGIMPDKRNFLVKELDICAELHWVFRKISY